MTGSALHSAMTSRLIDSLYVEAMVLADEARACFDNLDARARQALAPEMRVVLACESLKVTTRLMHVIAWLLNRRAEAAGELSTAEGAAPERRLGAAAPTESEIIVLLPEGAREMIAASSELYARISRLDRGLGVAEMENPARHLYGKLVSVSF